MAGKIFVTHDDEGNEYPLTEDQGYQPYSKFGQGVDGVDGNKTLILVGGGGAVTKRIAKGEYELELAGNKTVIVKTDDPDAP